MKLSLTAAYGKCFVVITNCSFTSKVFAPAEDGPVSVSTTTTPICKQLHAHNKRPKLTWLISSHYPENQNKGGHRRCTHRRSHTLTCLHSKQSRRRAAEKAAGPHRTHANVLACFPSLQSHPNRTDFVLSCLSVTNPRLRHTVHCWRDVTAGVW